MSDLRETALTSKAWPFEEARKLAKRYEKAPPAGCVLLRPAMARPACRISVTFGERSRAPR